MAGLYVILGHSETKRIDMAADRLTFFSDQETREIFVDDYFSYCLVSQNNPDFFGTAYDPKSGIRVITSGRVAWSSSDWIRSQKMTQYQGGLSNRLILDQYLNKGIAGVERHNGSAILLIWDPRLYVGFERDDDYYPRWMQQGVRFSGGMWSLEDNHFLGTREFVAKFNPQTVLTACTSDWLFKGYGLEKQHQQLFGKNLPTFEFTNQRVNGFLPNYPRQSPPEFDVEIQERILSWFIIKT